MADFIYSSIYGDLTRNVQARFNALSAQNRRLFDNVIYSQYLNWDTPSTSLDFNEVLGKYNISVAAATIGDESKEPILGRSGVEALKESVLHHALTLPMTIQEYRKILAILDSKSISDESKKAELIKTMWGDVQSVVKGVEAKLDLIFLGALSNGGILTLDENNNPEGGVRGTIDFKQPSGNIASATKEWTDVNKDSIDCFEDIQGILDAAQDKVAFSKILCSPSLISYICRTSNVKKMIWGSDKGSRLVQLSDLNQYMTENNFPTFEPIRRQVVIQNGKELKTINPFNEKNMVFIPQTDNGYIGTVKNAWANNELKPEVGVAYSNYGRIRVSQWGVGESQNSNGVEFTKAEAFALPVITEMNGVYTLKTKQ